MIISADFILRMRKRMRLAAVPIYAQHKLGPLPRTPQRTPEAKLQALTGSSVVNLASTFVYTSSCKRSDRTLVRNAG